MPHNPEQVELRPAYAWDCPLCGRERFERGIVLEMDPETLIEMRKEHGIEPWEEGNFIVMPTQVTCQECQATFDTNHYGDEHG